MTQFTLRQTDDKSLEILTSEGLDTKQLTKWLYFASLENDMVRTAVYATRELLYEDFVKRHG